jgi:phosphinothricin acetyltransferase
VGVYHAVGYKLGVWHDVGWWHRSIQPRPSLPTPPIAFEVLRQTSTAWEAALHAGMQLLRV